MVIGINKVFDVIKKGFKAGIPVAFCVPFCSAIEIGQIGKDLIWSDGISQPVTKLILEMGKDVKSEIRQSQGKFKASIQLVYKLFQRLSGKSFFGIFSDFTHYNIMHLEATKSSFLGFSTVFQSMWIAMQSRVFLMSSGSTKLLSRPIVSSLRSYGLRYYHGAPPFHAVNSFFRLGWVRRA